jgi:hypothetical protein
VCVIKDGELVLVPPVIKGAPVVAAGYVKITTPDPPLPPLNGPLGAPDAPMF